MGVSRLNSFGAQSLEAQWIDLQVLAVRERERQRGRKREIERKREIKRERENKLVIIAAGSSLLSPLAKASFSEIPGNGEMEPC